MGLMINFRCKNLGSSMSPLGHKRTFGSIQPVSALAPKADMVQHDRDVSFVPKIEGPSALAIH
jgi:hypothetical protein